MNGKVKGIIACGVVMASLAGTMVFLNMTGKEKEPEASSSSSEDETVNQVINDINDTPTDAPVIIDRGSEDIKSIKVTNEKGGYTFERSASGKTEWTISEIEGLTENTVLENSLYNAAGQISAYKAAEENVTDWAKYGLEEPRATVEIMYNDDTSAVMKIGDESPEDKYSYVCLEGKDTAFMVDDSKLAYYFDPATAYVDLSLIEQPEDGEQPPYGVMTITRSDWDDPVVIENEIETVKGMLSEQVISSPIYSYLNMNDSPPITHGMWGLVAAECRIPFPTDEDLKECGLIEPACVVSFKGEGYDYTLKIGDKVYADTEKEGEVAALLGYYCTLEGVSGKNAVFLVDGENLPWATFKMEDITSDIVLPHFLIDMTDVTISVGGEDYVFDVTTEASKNDETHMEVTAIKLGDKDIDVKNFKTYYEYIMTCPSNEICFDEPEGECEFAIAEHMKNGQEDKLEFYKDTSRRYIVKHNGKSSYRIQSTWLDTLLENVDNLKNGQPINDNF